MTVTDGWWRASSRRATFAFQVMENSIVTAAPYGWKLLGGKSAAQGVVDLLARGFTVERMTS